MAFELGKTYMHESGKVMKIQGRLHTESWGDALIGEDLDRGELIPVGETEEYFIGWKEAVSDKEAKYYLSQLRAYFAIKVRDNKDDDLSVELLQAVQKLQDYFQCQRSRA